MPEPFFTRLKNYYQDVARVLRGEADASNIFPNTSDKGFIRENIYAEFLRQHAPSKCNVFLGGYLFDEDGNESKQMDVIITTDTTPRYDLYNQSGKSFSPVEGSLGVASIKSKLDKDHLKDALEGIASIPPMKSLVGRIDPTIDFPGYDDWPYKIIYATNALSASTILNHLKTFYQSRNDIPVHRRPNIIHVAGQYSLFRHGPGMVIHNVHTGQITESEIGDFNIIDVDPDVNAIMWILQNLQKYATASSYIIYTYDWIINKVNAIPPRNLQ